MISSQAGNPFNFSRHLFSRVRLKQHLYKTSDISKYANWVPVVPPPEPEQVILAAAARVLEHLVAQSNQPWGKTLHCVNSIHTLGIIQ